MFGLEGSQFLSVLGVESHLRRQEEVSPGTIKEENGDWKAAAGVSVKVKTNFDIKRRAISVFSPVFATLDFWGK